MKPSLDTPLSNCVIIDFMAYARKVPVNKINVKGGNLLTFGDIFRHILNTFMSLGENSGVIHIIFDLYKSFSIKESERRKKAKDGHINITISSLSLKGYLLS